MYMLHQQKTANYDGCKYGKLFIPFFLQAQVKHKQVSGVAGKE